MRVLLVTPSTFTLNYGGGQVYIRNLVQELIAQKIVPDIIAVTSVLEDNNLKKCLLINGVMIHEYTLYCGSSLSKNLLIEKARKLIREINPDIVHAHAIKDIMAEACREENIPCVVTAHHGGIICPQGALLNQFDEICSVTANDNDCLPCVLRNIRGGVYFYHFYRHIPAGLRFTLSQIINKLPFIPFITPWLSSQLIIRKKISEYRSLSNSVSMIIAPSVRIAEALIRNGITHDKVLVVPHGIPLDTQKKPLNEFKQRSIRFFYVGRINYVKGIHILLSAFSMLSSKPELFIIGEAVTRDEKRYRNKLKLRYPSLQIQWLGFIPQFEINKQIADYDVMIHPAIYLEVFGLTIAEALAQRRPIIATRCGGPEMQIEDGVNGYLVPPNDPIALTERMQYLATHPEEIKRLSGNIRQPISVQEHANDLIEIYRSLINR